MYLEFLFLLHQIVLFFDVPLFFFSSVSSLISISSPPSLLCVLARSLSIDTTFQPYTSHLSGILNFGFKSSGPAAFLACVCFYSASITADLIPTWNFEFILFPSDVVHDVILLTGVYGCYIRFCRRVVASNSLRDVGFLKFFLYFNFIIAG